MTIERKVVIGLVGEMGSGKDTAIEYLKNKYQARLFRFADPLKETLGLYFDKISREDLQWLYGVLKKRFGNDVLSRGLRKKFDTIKSGIIGLNGMRMPEDYNFVKSFKNSYVIYITIDQKTRWQRIRKRGEKSDDAVDFGKFKQMELAETERHIPEIGKKADFTIINDGKISKLYKKIDQVMQTILNLDKKN